MITISVPFFVVILAVTASVSASFGVFLAALLAASKAGDSVCHPTKR